MNLFQQLLWELGRRYHNFRHASVAKYPGGINLYVDDVRKLRLAGWYHAATAEEAMEVLESRTVNMASFDHDLGPGYTGYDLVKWLADQFHIRNVNYWPRSKPVVHSANPIGRANMESVINRYGPYLKLVK